MLSIQRLHKWLFGLTLIISLVSFTEVDYGQAVYATTTTELVVVKNADASVYCANFYKLNSKVECNTYISFNFTQFLQTYNHFLAIKEQLQNQVVLDQDHCSDILRLRLLPFLLKGDEEYTFLG